MADAIEVDLRTTEEIEETYTKTCKTAQDLDNSISAHVRWRTQYRKSVEGRITMLGLNPTHEAATYLNIEWAKFDRKCRDVQIGLQLLMATNPDSYEKTMKGVETQAKEYGELSDKMAKVLQKLTQFNRDPTVAAAAAPNAKEPKIKKELCPDLLTKDTTPIEFRKFLRDYKVYYKESYMDKASLEGQHHYLLKCLDAELGERLLAISEPITPIFPVLGNANIKSCISILEEEFNRRFPVTNRRKDFFMQSQGTQQFTAYIDKLRNMAVEADLASANPEDLIVVMGIVGCKEDELRGELQKLEAPKLEDILKLGEAYERKTFAEKGFTVKVNAAPVHQSGGARQKPQGNKRTNPNDDPQRRKEIENIMKGKCYRCGEAHQTDKCPTKGQKINCTSCNRRGHTEKACYSKLLQNKVSTNQVTAEPKALTYQPEVQTRMVRIDQGPGACRASELPTVQPQSVVNIDGKNINLDEPPKPIPPMWM